VGTGPGAGPYSVAYYDENLSSHTSLSGISGLLQGAAWDGTNYFVATTGGIYWIDSSNSVRLLSSGHFMGIIRVNDYIIAITNDGTLYYFKYNSLDPSSPPYINPSNDGGSYSLGTPEPYYTGAMSSWNPSGLDTDPPQLLLLGVRTQSRTNGYREVLLDTSGSGKPVGNAATPGSGSPSTVSAAHKNRYESSIAKHAVFSIFQVSGSPVFASTTKDGLWSLRNDEWNAEE
jgi:hypothetical protein